MRQLSQRFVSPVTSYRWDGSRWLWLARLGWRQWVGKGTTGELMEMEARSARGWKNPGRLAQTTATTASDGNLLLGTYPKGFTNIIL